MIRRDKNNNGYLRALVNGYQADDFEFLFAGGSGDLDLITHLAVEQGFTDRRGGGYEAVCGMGFPGTDRHLFAF